MTHALIRLIVVNVAFMTGAMSLMFLNAYLEKSGLTKSEIGLAEGAFWITSVFIQPWLGPALDRIGRARFMQAGAALLAVACALYGVAPAVFWVILPLRILQGLGFAVYLTSAWAWVSDHAPPGKMHSVFAIFGVSSLVGGVAGPAVAQSLYHPGIHSEEVRMFWAGGALAGFATLASLTLGDKPRTAHADDDMVVGLPAGAPAEPHLAVHTPGGASLLDVARRPRLRLVTLGSLAFGLTVGSLFGFAAAYLKEIGVDNVSVFLIVLTLVAGVGRGACGPLSGRFGAANLVTPSMLGLALGCIGLGALPWFDHPPTALLLLAGGVAGLGYGIVYPVLNALACERLPHDERGRGVSLVAASVDSGNFVGAAVAGVLAQHYGDAHMFLGMGLAAGVLAILARAQDRP